jgi:serine protease Do
MRSRNREKSCLIHETRRDLLSLLAAALIVLLLAGSSVAAHRRSVVVETVARAGPAVVNIRTEQIVQRRSSPLFGFGDSFFDEFFSQFSPPRRYRTQSLGSGAIIDPDGLVVTNAHVVEKASKIYVALPGETSEREATLVGIDAATDLAVLKLNVAGRLPSLTLAADNDLLLGETVIAIGNPLGLENSVTTGVISAPKRRLPDGSGGIGVFIQTDALINPGNSGGPLLNIDGRLIGINTAIAQQAQGIGFAIPVDVIRRVVNDLIAYGRIRPAYSGILPGEISRNLAQRRGAGGVLITELDRRSPAERAGLRVADVILAVDGVQTESAGELLSLLRSYPPGSEVRLSLLRGVDERVVTLQLTELPQGYAERYLKRVFGIVTDEGRRGVFIREVIAGSPAAALELRPGDGIGEIDGVEVRTLDELKARIETRIGKLPLRFTIVRGNRGYLIELP